MAFISKQVHDDDNNNNFSGNFQTTATTGLLPMWYDDDTTSPSFFDNYGVTIMPQDYEIIPPTPIISRSPSSWKAANSFPERFGVSDHMVVPASPTAGFSKIPNRIVDHYDQKVEQDEYFCSGGGAGYDSNSWSSYPTSTSNWESESPKISKQEAEEPTLKIGRYSMEERKDKIMRYLKKRNQRNFNKTIKYECRKTLADKRIRVRGRFAKNNNNDHLHQHEHHRPCDDHQVLHSLTTAADYNPSEEEIRHQYTTNNFLMKEDNYEEEEEWLQEAMASLLYSPQII